MPSTAGSDQVLLLSPSPEYLASLPYGKLPDRRDFKRFANDDTARERYWQHAMDASQRLMFNLRPPVLDQGLVAAVRWLAESFERRTRVPVRVSASSEAMDMPSALQLVAYRTAQEALTNVHKHAQASRVHIDLSDHEGVLTLEVSDDGRGIAPGMLKKPRSFGLKGLEERARRGGGWLDISSRPGQGSSVIMNLPLTSGGKEPGEEP